MKRFGWLLVLSAALLAFAALRAFLGQPAPSVRPLLNEAELGI